MYSLDQWPTTATDHYIGNIRLKKGNPSDLISNRPTYLRNSSAFVPIERKAETEQVQHFIASLNSTIFPKYTFNVGIYLSKLPQGNWHFVDMCHPCFVICHPFSFTSLAPVLDSLTFFLSLTALAAFTLPKLMLTHHCRVFTLKKLMLTHHCRVSTKLDVILKLSFLSKHSPRSFISVWCLIWHN